MKKAYLFALLLSFSVCGYAQKATLELSGYTAVDVFGPFAIELIKADHEGVEIDYNGTDKEDVVSEVHRGMLKLKVKNRHFFDEWDNNSYKKHRYIQVKVFYKDLDFIEAQAGAEVTTHETLKSKSLSISCSMGAEIKADIYSRRVDAKSTMGGTLMLSGKTEELNATANMGGELRASGLESKSAFVKATMGGEVYVYATDELNATSSFGGEVNYVGGASVRHTTKSMGGDINRGN
jgi:hypothetical protein